MDVLEYPVPFIHGTPSVCSADDAKKRLRLLRLAGAGFRVPMTHLLIDRRIALQAHANDSNPWLDKNGAFPLALCSMR